MPPRITERGLNDAPTLVQNVETLAHLALIARKGPRWFRSVGTAAEPGSMLATIRRADGQPRITEVPLGLPLEELTGEAAQDGGAVLIGGYHGTWLPARRRLSSRWTTARSSRPGPGWARASSSACRPTAAASWRPRGWSATWRWRARASAARA